MTDKLFHPKLLTDKSQLQEIYNLRVTAYEQSPDSIYVNKQLFPQGLSDHLDNQVNTLHWIICDDNKIIAAARLAILDDFADIKDLTNELYTYELPKERPFAYYSRLIVHPGYRKLGLPYMLDKARIDYLRANRNIKFAIGWATPDRNQALVNCGFTPLGDFNYTWGNENNSIKLSGYIFTAATLTE